MFTAIAALRRPTHEAHRVDVPHNRGSGLAIHLAQTVHAMGALQGHLTQKNVKQAIHGSASYQKVSLLDRQPSIEEKPHTAEARLIDRKVELLNGKTSDPVPAAGTFTDDDYRTHTPNANLSNYEHHSVMQALDYVQLDGPAKYVVTAALGDSRAESLTQDQMEQRVSQWPPALQEKYDDAVDVIHRGFPHHVSMMLLDRLHSTPRLTEELAKLKSRLGGRR